MQIKGKDYCFHKSNGEAEWWLLYDF